MYNKKEENKRIVSFQEYPLSFGQKSLWFLNRLAPESTAYNLNIPLKIRDRLDTGAFKRAFCRLVEMQPALRTTFVARNGEPVQVVHEEKEIFFQHENTADWTADQLDNRLDEELNRPFDLESGPLMRVYLFSRAEDEHTLLIVIHHIIADLWSMSVFAYTLDKLYRMEIGQQTDQLPLQKTFYTDYVQWENGLVNGNEGKHMWAYWQKELSGDLPVLKLPTDNPRPQIQTYRGDSVSLLIDEGLSGKIKQLAREQGATLYTVLLAAFQVLLYRYTNQEEILVGSPAANRHNADFSRLVGYFVNPVVVRGNLAGNPAFIEFLQQVNHTVRNALKHQAFPFSRLVERLQPDRDPGYSPVFQVMFTLQKAPGRMLNQLGAFALGESCARISLGGIQIEALPLKQRIAQFDLTLATAEVPGGLLCSFQYNSDLFCKEHIRQMGGHWQVLLAGIGRDPGREIAFLPVLTQSETQQLLVDWNRTDLNWPGEDKCIHELFEMQAGKTPHNIAIIHGEAQFTFRQVNARANRLAHYLMRLGVKPEVRVGLFMKRSADLLVGMLAVLKAGGAYVPLDHSYPRKRLDFIRADAGLGIILSEKALKDNITANGCTVVCLDAWDKEAASEPDSNPQCPVAACNLAYIIYTSGSTGNPKGVAIEHRNTVAMLAWSSEQFPQEERSGLLASTSICFDISVFEIFLPLCFGGTVILAENILHLPALPGANRVTLINTVPSAMTELLKMGKLPVSVSTVNLAGEPLPYQLAEDIYTNAAVRKVYNLYGPSETTTYSTFALIKKGSHTKPPIGRPLANTKLYVLNSWKAPVPAGVPGELYIGGKGVARGYLNRPELTRERFIANPFTDTEGERLYSTGDIVRYLPGGELEYINRADYQVKIRGFRIELSEIEFCLRQHTDVKDCIVVVNSDVPGCPELVAYLAGNPAALAAEAMKSFLEKQVPRYMVPSYFVILEKMPLTPNGKTDRKALPAPRLLRSGIGGDYTAPRGQLEQAVAEIWADILRIDRIGIYDNFFKLGGHSLMAARVIYKVNTDFAINLPLIALFTCPVLEEFSMLVQQKITEQNSPVNISNGQKKEKITVLKRGTGSLDQLNEKLRQCRDN